MSKENYQNKYLVKKNKNRSPEAFWFAVFVLFKQKQNPPTKKLVFG